MGLKISGPGFQTSTENRQWWCWCDLFWQSVRDTGTSNWEDPDVDCWELDRWYWNKAGWWAALHHARGNVERERDTTRCWRFLNELFLKLIELSIGRPKHDDDDDI